MKLDREVLGHLAYEAYRASLNQTTDDVLRPWEDLDHETQLAFRDAGEAAALHYLPMTLGPFSLDGDHGM